MGMNVLSLFDGMSCGHLALDKSGIDVENYVASEVKGFAIEHTANKYPNTIKAGDVTKLHYEGGKLYRDCRRWCVGDSSKLSRARRNGKIDKDGNDVVINDYEVNKDNIRIINGIEYIDVVNLFFESDFDENNKVLADYKDEGLVVNVTHLTDEELESYKSTEHAILPNGEIAMWELGEMIYQGTFDVLIGGSPCFTADTPVLTSEGYKPIVDVKVGDMVVSHDGKLHEVVAFMPQGEKPIFKVNTSLGGDIRTTINHEFYVRKKRRVGHKSVRVFDAPKMVAIGDIAENCGDYYIGFPVNQNAVVPTWNGVEVCINQTTATKTICDLNINDENLWYLVGRYLGDGHLKSRKGDNRANYSGVVISCGNHKVEDLKTKISNAYNYSAKPHTQGTHRFCFDSVELAAFMSQFGRLAQGKTLPGFVYDMPVNLLKNLIQGYLDSDGSYIKNQDEWKLTSVNKNLLLGMGALIAKVYHRPYSLSKVNVSPTKVIEGRVVNQHDWYTIKWHTDTRKQDKMFYENGYIWGPIRSIEEDGVEEVYDITVDETHTFVASNVMVHNCQDFSVASATNGGKYGLEGSKSRLFFDYLRLKEEVNPKYFFLENVRMRGDSKEILDNFLGVKGIAINSKEFSIQNRPRVYWTNMVNTAPKSERTSEEIDFQNFKLETLPRLEWALYVKKYPGSYFGYEVGTPEYTKGGFEFDDVVTTSTRSIGGQVEGTKREIQDIVNFKVENGVQVADVSFTDEEADEIANMPCNKWAREELEKAWGRTLTNREFVEEIHNQLFEAIVKKSPSRDGMRYGKVGMSSCKDITNEDKMSCITRKQDRFPNSGLIAFGPYCRFVTKLEICKGQTVPYEFLSDLSYAEIQDVCGDGWTVDVISSFFEKMKTGMVYNETIEHTMNKVETTNKGEVDMSSMKVADVFNDDVRDTTKDMRMIPKKFYKTKTVQVSVPDDDDAIKAMREALRPWEKDYIPTTNVAVDANAEKVLALVRKECGEEVEGKIRYELYGWDSVKNMKKEDAPSYIRERVTAEVKNAIANGVAFDEVLKAKALWIL